MPPRPHSRYRPNGLFRSEDNTLFTAPREPFRYEPRNDSRLHRVESGDTLQNLAERFFSGPHTARLWWIIADFQPEPILDPTEELTIRTFLIIPSDQFVRSIVLGAVEPPAPKLI